MKHVMKLLALLLALMLALTLASCKDKGTADTAADGQTETAETTDATDNAVTVDPESGQNTIEDTSETYTSITASAAALMSALTDDQKNTALPATYTTGTYTITAAGDYYFSGDLTGVIEVKKNAGAVHIYLDGVTYSAEGKSVISSKSGSYVTVTLIGTNALSNSGDTAKHVIDSKETLVINGSGTLTITSTKSAIACDATFYGLGGTVNVTAAKHAVTADTICLDGMTVNAVSCGKDVLHAESDYDEVETAPTFSFEKGFVYIKSGAIAATSVLGDCIQADSFVYIQGGTFTLTTTPTWNNAYVATANREKGCYSTSTHQKVSRDSVRAGSTYAVLEESVKGIKVGEIDYYLATDTAQENELTVASDKYTILIEGGTFTIDTVDDAIHANSGSVLVYGGSMTISTSDDGIHADTNLKIAGSAVINVTNAYEGIEAQAIDISGGTTTITALDDGVNATNSNLTEAQQKSVCQINISGGRLDVTVSPNGDRDGIDSNGGIRITGGVVITRGPNSEMASPLDAASAVSVTGGTLIVIGNAPGASGSMGGPGGTRGGGPSGRGGMGGMSGTFTATLTKTQSNSKGLSSGSHTVTVGDTVISYTNAYTYGGYVTVYASAAATIN